MNKIYITLFLLLASLTTFASHIVGGEMIYEYIGPGTVTNSNRYRITLRLFRDQNCTGCAAMPANVFIGIYNLDNNQEVSSGTSPYFNVDRAEERQVDVTELPPCITNAPNLDYHMATYVLTVDLPVNAKGYTAAYQTCCRVNPLANVYNSTGTGGTGSTYSCTIPGTGQLGATATNSSPQFDINISVICYNKPFTLNFGAKDLDGDSLVYSFCEAYDGGPASSSNNINPSLPPYHTVPYINGFTAGQPLGAKATIDSKTGKISGVAPDLGKYVVCVCIAEYRNGKLIGTHRKDFIVNVNNCDFAGAELQPSYINCDNFSFTFQNLNTSPLNKTYFWDFGDNTTSTNAIASHSFADTGTYKVTLTVNKGESCFGTTTSVIKVYPGFAPGFTTSGICVNKPTNFTDTTKSRYGTVNYWNWSFGDSGSTNNNSVLQHPTHTYAQIGAKNIQFIVGNDKGCMDTVYRPVTIIDKPPIEMGFKDTLICVGDQLQLIGIGDGSFSWTPTAGNMTNSNTATPTVFPTATTRYTARLDLDGCVNTDTVQVRVTNTVFLRTMNDTTICATDPVQLRIASDGFRYQWSPAITLDDATNANPIARPPVTTTYQVTAYIGGCSATDNITIKTVPYPGANAGLDTIICYGTTAQLNASMVGKEFVWLPAPGLNDTRSLTPVVRPPGTTSYILLVRDDIGCPKPGIDTVTVTVLPKINAYAGRDTSVIAGQPMQFLATGGVGYQWVPATYLNKNDIPDPIGIYSGEQEQIRYKVLVSDDYGCVDSAFVSVKIFKTQPSVFVPTAFTPNSDGKNDLFYPIAVGISRIEYFRVYNRWGQLVFNTTENEKGWDGKINGKEQATGTYVWLVKAVDYTGKEFFAKGTVTLIR